MALGLYRAVFDVGDLCVFLGHLRVKFPNPENSFFFSFLLRFGVPRAILLILAATVMTVHVHLALAPNSSIQNKATPTAFDPCTPAGVPTMHFHDTSNLCRRPL
jgi:hypothetical protein